MALLDKIKIGIDTPKWLQMKPAPAINVAGMLMCCDKRNSIHCDNNIYWNTSAANLYRYSEWYNGSMLLNAAITLPAFAAGGASVFCPSFGIYGTLAAGCSTTKIVTATALTQGTAITALGVNQLIRTDMWTSYTINIIGATSGKVEQRTVVANTTGLTPTIYLDEPLSFTPAAGDTFELSSGTVQALAVTTSAAGQMRHYGIAQGVVGNSGATGITTGAASSMCALDEDYVPFDMIPGEGLIIGSGTYDSTYEEKRCLVATAAAADSITGQASLGDAIVLQNEYRNFQVRIVEDTVNTTAVGQRRIIKSHTAGASPVYTIGANWTVTPSANAKFVIEYPNIILLQNLTQAGMLAYNYSPNTYNNGTTTVNAFTWSTTVFNSTHAAVVAAGTMMFPSFGHQPETMTDGTRLSRHSYVYVFRGNSATLDRFDLAGAANGAWADALTYNNPISFTVGSSGDIDNITFDGSYAYMVQGATAQVYQFNIAAPSLVPWVQLPLQAGTAAGSNRVCCLSYIPLEGPGGADTTYEDKLGMIYVQSHLSTQVWRSDIIG